MSEQMPTPTQPLPEQERSDEPNTYVQNPQRAEVEAYASKEAEELATEANNRALAATAHLGEGWMSDISTKREISRQFKAAERSQQTADRQAAEAGGLYDMLQDTAGVAPAKREERSDEPNTYIQNRGQAEIMAYASRSKEEEAAAARAKGLEAVDHLADENWRSESKPSKIGLTRAERALVLGKNALGLEDRGDRSARREAAYQTAIAEKARKAADKQAETAAAVYKRFDLPATLDASKARNPQQAKAMRRAAMPVERVRDLALEAASHLGDEDWRSGDGRTAEQEIGRQSRTHKRATKIAAKTYRRYEKFRTRAH